jgi:hypothetical protein
VKLVHGVLLNIQHSNISSHLTDGAGARKADALGSACDYIVAAAKLKHRPHIVEEIGRHDGQRLAVNGLG